MRLIDLADNVAVEVMDPHGASAWYQQKLGMIPVTLGGTESENVTLAFDKNSDSALWLIPKSDDPGPTPILATTNASKANGTLSERGVSVGPVETDRQGTRYFVMRDVEGNEIEVAEMS